MIASQDGNPTLRLLEEIFKTKFYNELCDIFDLPANRVARLVLSQKNRYVKEDRE